ncbi:hypothetical protein Q4493_08865 [Colwellia sp. 1_MG-2023]|uniref:hypothetical protein n=1 Tax=Colwellia sp. 1_MG-2023 TaxID=3062649 RepID=UPI0026E310F2|nr:hypothetical protein [Colwellia sp. 1_MG-2023]MDO6445880.1 hypothetical protein [Colwellia sp. 1_MG-2023]
MSAFGLQSLIQSATIGDTVDLKSICQTLELKIRMEENSQDLCKICENDDKQIIIWLNKTLDQKTKFTFVAIAVADYILDPERVSRHGVIYDMFFLRDLSANKATKLIMLATRLAIPEHIIEKLSNALEAQFSKAEDIEPFDADAYVRNAKYLPEFVRCAIKESTSMFLIDNLKNKFEH